ncbi:hypothetical protein [Treponema primitia]|uniref:hypothetical protein n=1 Tax=Treponema primitia TaxID=88058 RepID=UPI0002555312|nr:hypothetical protein [Treponema primitia]
MKKRSVFLFLAALIPGVLITMGCATGGTNREAASVGSNVDTAPTKKVVLDWSNRSLGMPSSPPWLAALVLGNSNQIKSDFGIPPTDRVKFSIAQNRNRENARVQAGLLFAAKTANELKQYVITGAGSTLDEGELDIVEEITTAAKLTITGNEPVADFWQLVETEDVNTHQKSQEYLYYIVYTMSDSTWKALVRKYTNDIIGQLPNRAVQTNVARAFGDIDAVASREQEMTEAQFKAQIAAAEQSAKTNERIRLAEINQQTAANNQAEETIRAEAAANANAQRAALRSGDPVRVYAASVTPADVDWITALSTASNVLY